MKTSKFNVVKANGAYTFIYNTLTTSFVKISTKQWQIIVEEVQKNGNVIEENEVCKILHDTGILIDDDYNELNVYKYKYYSSMFQNSSLINSLAIDSEGHIYKCLEHLGLPNNRVGDLSTGTLSLNKLSETIFGHNPFESDECVNCNVFPICGGGCPIDRNKNWGQNKKYCSIYKRNLSEILPDFYKYKYSSK